MNILITGGAGFIGSHLAEYLISNGNSVVIIDDLSTGAVDNLSPIKDSPDYRFVEGNICDRQLVQDLVAECDRIYHLAAAVGVRLIAERPVHTIETNITGTEVILEAANKYSKRTLLASSSEVYGKNESIPFREDDDLVLGNTTLSRWSYACSKAIDEFLGLAFYQQYGLEVIIARFFNTIGPRQTGQYGMVVPGFIQSALNNEPLMIYGSGKQTRCFCHVGDVIRAVTGLMDCPEAAGQVFNIGTSEEVTIEQLAERIIEKTSSPGGKEHISYQQAYGRPIEDMMRRVPCTDRVENTINWKPRWSLDETLDIIISNMTGKQI